MHLLSLSDPFACVEDLVECKALVSGHGFKHYYMVKGIEIGEEISMQYRC